MVEVAAAVPDDAQAIAAVHIRSWQAAYADILDPGWLAALSIEARAERWRDILVAGASQTLVFRDQGRITAFVSFGKCRDEGATPLQGEIWALYAAPDVWGQGTGRALLEHAAALLHASGCRSVSLWVLSANLRGIAFYERCGFECVPDSEKVFELGGRQVEEIAYVRQHAG